MLQLEKDCINSYTLLLLIITRPQIDHKPHAKYLLEITRQDPAPPWTYRSPNHAHVSMALGEHRYEAHTTDF